MSRRIENSSDETIFTFVKKMKKEKNEQFLQPSESSTIIKKIHFDVFFQYLKKSD